MQIIFGDHVNSVGDKYTVLELDTFKSPTTGNTMTAWCVVECIPLTELQMTEHYIKIHQDLMLAYKNQHWNYCKQAIEGLMGKWNAELDSFYTNLLQRVVKHEQEVLGKDWTGMIEKELPSDLLLS